MKRTVYIAIWIIIGLLLATIVHGAIEIPVIYYIVIPEVIKLPYQTWIWIHHVLSVALWLAGAWFGYKASVKYWIKVYGEKLE